MTLPRTFIAAVSVAGAAATAAVGWSLPATVDDARTFAVLVLLALVAAVIPIRFVRGEGTQGFTLEGGVFAAMLVTLPVGLVPAALVGSSLLAHGVRSRSIHKAAFNAGRTGLETAAGALAFWVVAPASPSPTDARSFAALIVAVIVFETTSTLAMAELFHRLSGISRLQTLRDVGRLSLLTFSVNTGLGIVLGAVAVVSPWILALSALLMVGLYAGFRGYAAAVFGRRRAEMLNDATHMLLDLQAGDDAISSFLKRLVELFGGRRGELLAEMPEGLRHWSYRDGASRVQEVESFPRTGLLAAAALHERGWVTGTATASGTTEAALVVPVGRHRDSAGALVIAGREGLEPWDSADASLLAAVANEVAVALDNVALLNQVEEERARLEAESTKLNNILGAATDGISSFLSNGRIEAWNPGMARITGVSAAAAVGQPWHAVLRLQDADGVDLAPTGDHVVARALKGDFAAEPLSLQVLRADGVWRRLQCTVSPVRDPDGDHRGVVMVARDVTTERELEDLKSDFIATVSHELRTPLTPLKGFLATLRNTRTALTDEQLASIHGSMSTQLTRLETLISDLLAVAELDHGQFNLYPEPLALGELVSEAVEVEAADQFARCTVTVDPEARAVADSVALVRVVRSLVSNAVKHTEGRVQVTIRAVGERVEIAVADEGPGIASWDQQRVFNRFERLGNHLRRTQGPGLGLTIARTLAQRMGGDVRVSSDIGRGAVFTLSLPRARPHALDSAPVEPGRERVDEATS